MAYRIEIKASARKEMEAFPMAFRKRIDLAILTLAETPRPPRCRKLDDDLYRVRLGDYRVVYRVYDDILLVVVVRIRHRSGVYR